MYITYSQLCREIAKDYNLELEEKHKKYFNEFPIVNGKRKINSHSDAIIVDREGNEYPYMLDVFKPTSSRNETKLIDFDYIYIIRYKSLAQLCKEANIELKQEECRICEGGGWTSKGIRYYYGNLICEH